MSNYNLSVNKLVYAEISKLNSIKNKILMDIYCHESALEKSNKQLDEINQLLGELNDAVEETDGKV